LPERDQRHASGVATASGLGPGIFVQRLNARFPEGLRMSARRERSTRYGAVVRKPSLRDRVITTNAACGAACRDTERLLE
jgi:hypothetical protein